MSAPQPPTLPDPTPSQSAQFDRAKSTLSYTLLITCPILLILPPRKLDLYTFSLGSVWLVSANHVVGERTGRGGIWRSIATKKGDVRESGSGDEATASTATPRNATWGATLPTEKARQVQERLKRERLLRAQPSGQGMEIAGLEPRGGIREDGSPAYPDPNSNPNLNPNDTDSSTPNHGAKPPPTESESQSETETKTGIIGLSQKLWMGSEKVGWKEKRLREEREALEEGRGYGGLIMDQIWDVWTWGKGKEEEEEEGEEDGVRVGVRAAEVDAETKRSSER